MAESKSQIGFEQAGLGNILKQNQLVVPLNQREYAWTERQVTQLFQDFARVMNDGGDYFLGTIVTIPRMNDTLEVVDGQQRLATTAIFLAAIRNYLRDINEEMLVESINSEFLTGIDRSKRRRVPKLRLNVADNDLFDSLITENDVSKADTTRESHRLLLAAAAEAKRQVRNIVATLDLRDHGDILNNWVSFIESRALAVLLRVPDDADAYKMFETLNDRGLRTSQADLIKNYLLGRSGDRISEVQSSWSYMRGALESLDEEDVTTVTFLRHALIVVRGYLREAEVYDAVQERVRSEQGAASFVTTLEQLANSYVASLNTDHANWNEYPANARRAVAVLNQLDIKPLRPLMLALVARMEKSEAVAAYQFLLSVAVRLLITATTRSGSVEIPLAEAAKDVFAGSISNAMSLAQRLDPIVPKDQEFKGAFETARASNARLARYYLRSLELAAAGESEPWFIPNDDQSVINLEHVLPKKPLENWPQFNEEDAKIYTNRIGNMVLLRASENSGMRSDGFDVKRISYQESPYMLTRQVSEFSDWSITSIIERQKGLAILAIKAWPLTLKTK